ncbi:PKD domain-containing protein [Chitinophaga agrisoli]|uniref:PKD domain-containing protein n=1 Tax=Chitinophaga agrisoli TaxID=2607653 RepID=A0A5B2VRA5_9BACT|nr:PKD domain-containing protein [Chitinophaga agrisoli]KAA2240707.1 PKD domain-containing protein [Chitinophaga agrisoli]
MHLFSPGYHLRLSKLYLTTYLNVIVWLLGSLSARAQAPTITSFSPVSICPGQLLTIAGTNFIGATKVQIGGIDAAFTVDNAARIRATVPIQAPSGVITVTTPTGSATSTTPLTVLPVPIPGLTHVDAADGPFSNCNGSMTYELKVRNSSTNVSGTGYTYQINWGDNSTPFTQVDWPTDATGVTSHTYASQGFFPITVTITAPNGCVQNTVYRFYNGLNPLASFSTTSSTTGLCAPASVEFQIGNWFNNTPGTTYEVDFGDGSPHVTLDHPLNPTNTTFLLSHQYLSSSCPTPDFKATLMASNGCYTTTYTLDQIIVRQKPLADFGLPPVNPCVNTPVCIENQTTEGYSGNGCTRTTTFHWDFGDGSTSDEEDPPCHTYATAGTYTITLTASNSGCGGDTKTKQITVSPPSPPPVVSAPSITYCQGATAAPLTATGTGLLWYTTATGGVGTPTAPTPSTAIPGVTTYYVGQTVAGNCEGPRVAITVTVNALPDAPLTSPVQLCQGQTAGPLTATGTGLLWYTTASGGTGSPTAPVPATATVGSTTWYVSQTANNCEGPRAALVVSVSPLAMAPVVTSPVVYCQNQPALPLTAGGINLLWYTVPTGGTGSPLAPTPPTAIPGSTSWYVSQTTGCGEGPRAQITVTVIARGTATIAYTPATLCNTAGAAPVQVTRTGAGGGAYTVSPAGLSINASTGEISPAYASAGVYTITYTIAGTPPCPDIVATATVTVNGTPAATIAYPALCTSDGITPVNLNGSAGGVFSSTAGLTIDAASGAITPAISAPGTYVVTYSIAAAAPCPGFTTTTSVTVTKAPVATIRYQPANLCNIVHTPAQPNLPVPVTLTGNTGGTYSITPAAGLPINTTTGEINPSGATAGSYTVTYTVAGAGGCADYQTTTTVVVNSAPAATISYGGTPFCGSTANPQPVVVTGTTGGSFSAGAGLSINAVTGEVTPSLSTPGVYTVTYTIAASPPCPGFTTSTAVQIDESPVVSFPVTTQAICSGGTAVFRPSSTVGNTTYNWAVAGALPGGVSGVSSGTVSDPSAAISLSFTNTGTANQSLTIRVTPVNPTASPCPGTAYDLTLTIRPVVPPPVTTTVNRCMGEPPAPLQVTSLPGNTIRWFDENGTPLNAAPVISTTSAGQFRFYVSQVTGEGCESPKAEIIAIVHPTLKIVGSSFTHPSACGVPSGTIILQVLDINNGAVPNLPVVVHYNRFQTPLTMAVTTDASGTITLPLTAGTYSGISVETSGSCNSQSIPDVFVLRDPTPPTQPVAGYNPPLCAGTPLQLTALSTSSLPGPIDYVWAGPAFGPAADTVRNTLVTFPSPTVGDGGTYAVYAIQNNCISAPSSFAVTINPAPTKPVISTRTPLCVGDDLVLQAYSSIPDDVTLTYQWRGPNTAFPVNAPNAAINNVKIEDAGVYSITVSSPTTGCSVTADTLIQVGGYPIVQFAQDTLNLPTGHLLPLSPVITNAADPGILPVQSYTWTPMQDLVCNDAACSSPVATVKNDVCYKVTVTNVYGCVGSDDVCINVFCESSQVFIPNAFAPTGNVPENRVLMVRASGINSVKSFRIFNRWGRIVFERSNFAPNSPDFGWDGRVNGKLADTGVYVYTVEVICENGVPYTYKGNVTLF